MYAIDMRLIEKLDEEDREKIVYFLKLLLDQAKYQHTKDEIRERRAEIERGETLTHEEIWDQFNV